MPTIREALAAARKAFAAQESAGTDAEELLSRLLGVGRGDVRREGDRPLDDVTLARFEQWVRRRAAGEPVQYITGRAAFRTIDLAVNPAVLVPRPETEVLVEAVLERLEAAADRWPEPRVLDLGTGSGAIALAIASEHAGARLVATDASEAALEVAQRNAFELGLADRVAFRHGEWFDAVDEDERFEAIVSNPPYVADGEWDALPDDVKLHEPREALFSGASGLEALREIVDLAPTHLVAGGLLALELSEFRAEDVAAWLDGAHDWAEVSLLNDLSGRPRILVAARERGPAIAPLQWPEDR